MGDAELAERHDAADRLSVLGRIWVLRLERRARCVRTTAARQWCLLDGSRRRHDVPVESRDRDSIAGLYNRVLCGAVEGRIGLGEEFFESGDRLNVRAVVDVVADGNALGDFRHSAEMISVPVRG